MKSISVQEIAQVIGAQPLAGRFSPELMATGVSIDSRSVKPGDVFFALPGQRVDGHEYVRSAVGAGAAAAVIKRLPPGWEKDQQAALLKVEDVLQSLQELARWNRRQYELPVIGVTGSTGKTTTKDLLAAVLSQRFNTLKTSGNYNNEIGLPLTLLNLDGSQQAAVVEMAMRGLGEIAQLCSIAAPSIGVITNIGHTHEELLGSQTAIASAKGELLESLPPGGAAVLNGQDPWLRRLAEEYPGRVLFYGVEKNRNEDSALNVAASDIRSLGREGSRFWVRLPGQEGEVNVSLPGEHNVLNALAALTVGYLLGMTLGEMALGLAEARLSAMRLDLRPGVGNTTIINDAYNANPDSMKSALQVLQDLSMGRSIAVLGEMYELGDYAQEGHNIVGAEAVRREVSLLLTVGPLAEYIAQGALRAGLKPECSVHFADNQSASEYLLRELRPGDTVLVKGSRGMKMEQIVDALT